MVDSQKKRKCSAKTEVRFLSVEVPLRVINAVVIRDTFTKDITTSQEVLDSRIAKVELTVLQLLHV